MKKEANEPMRYERKFLINEHSAADIKQLLKFNPARFKEIYHQRNVNNIYFDTPDLNHYYDNVEGAPDRTKVRIRWYGSTFGKIENPVLEYKIKHGLLGKKLSFPLASFTLDTTFSKNIIVDILAKSTAPENIKNELLSLYPTLLNSYTRSYYLSDDENFRITIDSSLTFYRIKNQSNSFIIKSVKKNTCVMELKYDISHESEAKEVATHLPFAITKSSKYLQGIEEVFV